MSSPNAIRTPDPLVGDAEKLMNDLIARLVDATGAEVVTLYLYDSEREVFCLPVAFGLRDVDTFKNSRPRIDRVAGKVAKSRQPIIADDAKSHPDMNGPFTFRERIKSSAGFPIISGSVVVGVCFVCYHGPHHFTRDEQDCVEHLLSHFAAAIPPRVVAQIAKKLIPLPPQQDGVDRALGYLVASACNYIHAPLGVWVLDERSATLTVRASTGLRRQFVDRAAVDANAPSLLTRVLRDKQLVAITEPASHLEFPFRDEAEHDGWQAVLVVPVVADGSSRALLAVFSFESGEFTEEDRAFSLDLADRAAKVLTSPDGQNERSLDPDQEGLKLAKLALTQSLDLIVEKAMATFGAAIVTLYPYDQDRDRFDKPVARGVKPEFWDHPEPSPNGLAATIALTGAPVLADDAKSDPRMSKGFVDRHDVASSAGLPLTVENEVTGVLFINYGAPHKFTPDLYQQLLDFANWAAMTIYNERLFREERRRREMAEFANTFNETLDRQKTLQAVVDKARELTYSSSSSIFLWNPEGNRFELCARSPDDGTPRDEPRAEAGLTRHIVDTGERVRIGDADTNDWVRRAVKAEGTKSILGVPVQVKGERIGVLFVNSRQPRHFSQRDGDLIQSLANFGALAIERTLVLDAVSNVNRATADFLRLDDLIKELLKRTVDELHFEFAALQLVNLERNEIETVDGINAPWGGECRHSLDADDIQSYVVRTRQTKVIAGWHKYFDKDIYAKYHHDRLVRVFTPIVTKNSDVVGTIEAGFYTATKSRISNRERDRLVELVAEYAPAFEKARLLHVLETIVSNAVRLIRADSGSIHALNAATPIKKGRPAPTASRYVYESCAGRIDREFLKAYPPRQDGINRQALEEGRCVRIDNPAELRRANRKICEPETLWKKYPDRYPRGEGVRALACLPLVTGGKYEGIFYVHFWRNHKFTEDEIAWLELFAAQASVAVQEAQVFDKLRDRSQALTGLSVIGHQVVESLTNELRLKPLLETITRHARSALQADLVTLYEYDQTKNCFTTPPNMDGERQEEYMMTEVRPDDAQAVLVRTGKNIYAPDSMKEKIFYNPQPDRPPEKGRPFVEREGIKSSAGILLKVRKTARSEERDETVGVMFVNYRTHREFTDSERAVIESFASFAAIAIQAARTAASQKAEQLAALREIDLGIANQLDREDLVSLTLNKALEQLHVTGGYGVLHLFDEDAGQFEVLAHVGLPEGDARRALSLHAPETPARAARGRETVLLTCDAQGERFEPLVAWACAELSTPLLRGDQLLGVMTLGSAIQNELVEAEKRSLETFASQALVGINYLDRANLLDQLKATLSDIAQAKDWHDALQLVAQRSLDVLAADDAFILPLDPEGNEFLMSEVVHARREGLEQIPVNLNLPQEGGIARAVLEQKMIAVDDVSVPPEETRHLAGVAGLRRHGVRAFVGAALNARGKQGPSVGVLYVDYRQPHHFTRDERNLLREFASEAAIVIQKAREEEARRQVEKLQAELRDKERQQQVLQWQTELNRFGSGFAHRVGNLLGTIPHNFEDAREALRSGDMETLREHFNLLTRDVETVRRIIVVGRQIAEAQASKPVPCDLNHCIQSALDIAPRRPNVRIDRQEEPALPKTFAHHAVVANLIADLIDNAVRAMPAGGDLTLRTYVSPDGQSIVVEVKDTGKGIDERIKSRLMEQPFVTGRSDGLGLGLWLARETMTRFQGSIAIDSEPGKGTMITLRFPVKKELSL